MLVNLLFACWLLSSLSPVYGLDALSTSLSFCNVNGTFAVGDDCPENSGSLKILNGSIISHADKGTSSSSTRSPVVSVTSSPSGSTAKTGPFTSSSPPVTSSSTTASNPEFTRPIIGHAPPAKGGPFTLTKLYQGNDFMNEWDFFSDADPTHGSVHYVNKQDAVSLGLITVQGNTTIIKVDDTTQLQPGQFRDSVRISSQMRLSGGLVIASIKTMPTGCSIWPAFWMVGDNWPENGEVDIIEGVNLQDRNQMTLHTAPGCMRDDQAKSAPGQSKAFSGAPLQASCDVTINSNSGCGIMSTGKNSFGAPFNSNGGGVIATSWDLLGIRIWMFPNGTVPHDIIAMAPVPDSWPVPDAFFDSTTCPVDQYFSNMMMVFDTTLCGDFAGNLFPSSGCPGTCAETVANPNNFKQAKWTIDYVAVYN